MKIKRNEKGSSAVEFAIILPVLMIIIWGIIEYGWIMTSWIIIANAASEGARAAIMESGDPDSRTAAENAVIEALWSNMTDDDPPGELIITTTELAADAANNLPKRYKVKVSWTYQELVGYLPDAIVPNKLTAECIMAYP